MPVLRELQTAATAVVTMAFLYNATMLRRLVRILGRSLPALIVGATWLAWWIIPERPLRTCPLGTTDYCEPTLRPANGQWAIIVPSNRGIPSGHDFVLRFDPVQGRVERMPTPHRVHDVRAPDASLWAWSDIDGRIHVASLPDNRPLLTTPPDRKRPIRWFQISPDGRWLLVNNETNERIDVWDVANGTKCATLADEGGTIWCILCGFSSPDRMRVPWLDQTQPRVRATVYQLPSGSVVETIEIPCEKGQKAYCPTDDSLLVVYGGPQRKKTAWDVSASPAHQMVNMPRAEIMASPDGRFRVTWPVWSDVGEDWEVTNAVTGDVILRASDASGTKRQIMSPYGFSADGRFLVFFRCLPATTFPAWTPTWFVNCCRALGYGQDRFSVVLCDPTSGREVRELPGINVVYIAPHGDRIWLLPEMQAGSQKILEEWPITPLRPPWWLWTLTAVGAVWYARCVWRRPVRSA
jgi:hypothetical protein